MIDSIEIHGLRGIQSCKLDGLSRVNLFFGKNNCGKSTFLEALFLVCGQSNPLLPSAINMIRTYEKSSENDIRLFFYKMNTSSPIEITIKGSNTRTLSISTFREDISSFNVSSGSTQTPYEYGLRMNYQTEDGEFNSEVRYDISTQNKIKPKPRIDDRYVEYLNCLYLSPRYDSHASVEGLKNIYLNKDEIFLSDALRILEPSAKDPIFIDNVMLVDAGLPERIPINLMGDGIRKIVSFITSIYACKDGILLIDELSNGFHYSVMKPMWEIVLNAAEKNNVQIFATTHDLDSIRGLRDAANDTNPALASAYKLLKMDDGELKSYRYTYDQLDNAIQQEVEIR